MVISLALHSWQQPIWWPSLTGNCQPSRHKSTMQMSAQHRNSSPHFPRKIPQKRKRLKRTQLFWLHFQYFVLVTPENRLKEFLHPELLWSPSCSHKSYTSLMPDDLVVFGGKLVAFYLCWAKHISLCLSLCLSLSLSVCPKNVELRSRRSSARWSISYTSIREPMSRVQKRARLDALSKLCMSAFWRNPWWNLKHLLL